MAILASAVLVAGAASAGAQAPAEPRVVIAVLPYGTTVEEIGAHEGISPGVISAGMGQVGSAQTYLDISQGNRINESLYDSSLPLLAIRGQRVPRGIWDEVVERAAQAPQTLTPGLLTATLRRAGVPVHAGASKEGLAELIAVDRDGRIPRVAETECDDHGCGPGLSVVSAETRDLPGLASALAPSDMLIAIAAAPPADRRLLPFGIAGAGFDGTLTSGSTRTDGVVIASDIAPTVLERLGVAVPEEMNGTSIRATGEADAAAVADLQERLTSRPTREVVVLVPLLIWLALAGFVALALGERGSRVALPLVGLACAWGPAVLLVVAAVDAGTVAATLILGVGAIALAAATWILVPGYAGLALACAVSVGWHAIDVVAGSPLTAHSVLGPNPSGGVRFFGIGNEHAASLTTLAVIGTGAWLATRNPSRRVAAGWFVAVAIVCAAAYAPGQFGADVGSAIMLAAGGGAAAALALGMRPRRAVVAVAGAGLAGVAVLAAVDAALGGAHLTRSVLDVSDAGELGETIERRLRLMVATFTDPIYPQLLGATVVLLVVGFVRRDSILAWFGRHWPARVSFIGALVAVLVGTVANDSGSVLLVIGTIYLAACAGFVWGMGQYESDGPRGDIATAGRR